MWFAHSNDRTGLVATVWPGFEPTAYDQFPFAGECLEQTKLTKNSCSIQARLA